MRFTSTAAAFLFFGGPSWVSGLQCNTTFSSISASEFIQKLQPGWNLGNTLDATPTEGSWNNPPVVASTFDTVKNAGFKSVRLPVTYVDHFVTKSPDWTVNSTWLQRVSDVVDMITDRGLYTVVNVHHDATDWADITAAGANVTEIEDRFYKLWYQIGTKLACKSDLVAFEPINEPPCNNATDGEEINKLNTIFLQAINDAGGYNPKRVVTLVGCGEDSVMTSEWFKAPTGFSNPWAIQFHYYSPYQFIFSAWGATIWGSDSDKSSLATDFQLIRNNFTNVPLVIGEFGASTINCEPAARWKYTDFLTRTAIANNISYILWDNGLDNLDRNIGEWRDPTSIEIINNGPSGVKNSLPDSTVDAAASTQWSSAYIFHKKGTNVTDQTLPFILNGNTLLNITESGNKLVPGADYIISESNITFKASFLSKHVSSSTAPGVHANLTLTFSAGARPIIQLVQYAQPILQTTSASASSVSGADLDLPITWGGVAKPATAKATEQNGDYLEDSWTEYLGSLQQGRTTYSSQWNWDDSHVIITEQAIADVISSGQSTTFMFEFYPRDGGVYNAVNFTLTV